MLVSAARYLGISPWELEEAPIQWTTRALWAQEAENEAQKRHNKMG